ncbi:MAG: GMC family oxidoreductase [Steroidobacteraceae bacterium]
MFRDATTIGTATTITTEVCIIGGGLAGLVIARELSEQKIASCVIESGGFDPDPETRDLYRGECVGIPYDFADGCRSRFLGGSSNCWGGWCRPMEPLDYERRSWVPHSGWPFGPQELAPYYERAESILQLGTGNYDTEYWTKEINRNDVRRLPLSGKTLTDGISRFSPPLQAGKAFRAQLQESTNITVLLHANVTNIVTDETAGTAQQVDVQTLKGNRFAVRARLFVLATGGIENARLLLVSNTRIAAGLGNGNDQVGRYFADHPRITSGWVHLRPQWKRNKLYDNKFQYQNNLLSAHGTRIAAQFAATPEVQEREGLLNARLALTSIFPGEHDAAGWAIRRLRRRYEGAESPKTTIAQDLGSVAAHPFLSMGFVAARLFQPQFLIRGVRMQATVEPAPDPESRVTLSNTRDALYMPRVRVNWRLSDNVKRTFDRMFALLRDELETNNIARVELDPAIGTGDWPDTFEREGNWHHMGTTRMHDSPRQGVVDRNCLIHGMNNLYVAGSSVFPTFAADFPTITLTALAVRLSRRIASEIRSP